MVDTVRYVRKPFYIDAVQVTDANIEDVAKWCNGEVRTQGDAKFVKVRVHLPRTERQTQAFAGDWVLYAGTGYKCYTDKAFKKSFVLAKEANSRPSREEPVEELRTVATPSDAVPQPATAAPTPKPRPKDPKTIPSVPADPVPTAQ